MRSDAAASAIGAEHTGEPTAFRGVGTDTRQNLAGRLYVALRGPRFDGHEFVSDAVASGAAAVMVTQASNGASPAIVCPDTLAALGHLGSAWARRCPAIFVGITGSNGKTSVKNMIRAILSHSGSCLATQGNYNNEIGVPLTLCQLSDTDQFAVIEMGAGKPGDIGYLTGLVKPQVGIITNAGPAHLEFLGDLEGVAREKGAMYSALGPDGTAVINADDDYCDYWRDLADDSRVVTFGQSASADVRASCINEQLTIETSLGSVSLPWRVPGVHHVTNAAGAAAAAIAAGAELEHVSSGLMEFEPEPGRFTVHELAGGVRIIDDAYNANPASLAAAIESVDVESQPAWLVMGQLAELGSDTARYHREAGEHARRAGFKRVFAVGENAADVVAGFGQGGEEVGDRTTLTARLMHAIHGPVTLLVKGSRSAGLEEVIATVERQLAEDAR